MKFSVITVTYNAGAKLKETIENILEQTFDDYEIVIKDGGSTDDSLKNIPNNDRVRVYVSKDKGIYDAMNEAVQLAKGDYVCFMNCGDKFYDKDVLSNAARVIAEEPDRKIYYGDAFFCLTNEIISQPKEITESICYRHMPNHQSCIFDRTMWDEDGFDIKYKIRGDYDFFLRAYFKNNVRPKYLGITVASYEGGGYSESNKKRDKEEHREIVVKYMGEKRANHYRRIMILTLQPLRTWIAQKSVFAGLYNSIKKKIYR